MQLLGCEAYPVAAIRLTITNNIRIPKKSEVLRVVERSVDGQYTTIIWVPKSLAKHLSRGVVIEALCLVSNSRNRTIGLETFALAVVKNGVRKYVYSRNRMWDFSFFDLLQIDDKRTGFKG